MEHAFVNVVMCGISRLNGSYPFISCVILGFFCGGLVAYVVSKYRRSRMRCVKNGQGL